MTLILTVREKQRKQEPDTLTHHPIPAGKRMTVRRRQDSQKQTIFQSELLFKKINL